MDIRSISFRVSCVVLLAALAVAVLAWTSVPVDNDPLVRMPGTQPGQVTLEAPNRCTNCHANYNTQVEPVFNWQGSMMSQAARDFLFWACFTVSAQDSIHAVGRPNATDICERCHFPQGWLEGRSDPTNASRMTGGDYDGVHCDPCHRQYNPFFETTHQGTREGNDWLGYWDETDLSKTKSSTAAATTYTEDSVQAQAARLFNGQTFFLNKLPRSGAYDENGAGQYFVSANNQKRASFADANASHQIMYSRYHKSKYFCSSCHDVSNPVLANLPQGGTQPGDGTTILRTEQDPAYSYFHVERTFSEFMLSAYGQQGGAPGMGPFHPSVFTTSQSNNYITSCQDCHMRDVEGRGCDKQQGIFRPTGSTEHPKSGQPLHDLTGGNAFVSYVLASAVLGSPNYDATNRALLNQGPAVLTLDLTQGLGINAVALLAGAERAKQQLLLAADIQDLSHNPATGELTFRVQNQTAHKLISGFPEGRRMFLNIKAYSQGQLIYELNPYDYSVGTLKGLPVSYSPNSPALAAHEAYSDALVYEMHPTSTVTGEEKTFHFALATGRYKDNRIPPKGFRIGDAAARLCEPVWHGVIDANYYTAQEYSGGYDEVSVTIPKAADAVQVGLYYQTTSREYIEFLRDEINGTGNLTLPPSAYVIQTDPFFANLKAWGNTIWQLWDHNKNVPCAAPFLMTQATLNIDDPCAPPIPQLQYAEPGYGQVTLTWSSEHSSDPGVVGYRVYYDQAGKAQLVAQVGLTTSYVDVGLTIGSLHCYKVTSLYDQCESDYSNVLCAVPAVPATIGQAKLLPDSSWVFIGNASVTAGQDLGWGCLYVESICRSAGLQLAAPLALGIGDRVWFTGMVTNVDGEPQLQEVRIVSQESGGPLLDPLGVINRSIGNDPSGSLNYVGMSTVGLYVRTWGTVTGVIADSRVAYIDDGSHFRDALGLHQGLRVQFPAGVSLPAVGSRVSVSGISRVQKHVLEDWTLVNGQLYAPGTEVYVPALWVRGTGDVQALN